MHVIVLHRGCLIPSDMRENTWRVRYVLLVFLKWRDIIWGVSSEAEGQTNHPKREGPCVAGPLEADVALHSLARGLTRL